MRTFAGVLAFRESAGAVLREFHQLLCGARFFCEPAMDRRPYQKTMRAQSRSANLTFGKRGSCRVQMYRAKQGSQLGIKRLYVLCNPSQRQRNEASSESDEDPARYWGTMLLQCWAVSSN